MTDHQHYTTKSLIERIIFFDWIEKQPGYTIIAVSDPEGSDPWDFIYQYSADTKPTISEIKIRDYDNTFYSYIIQEDKYKSLIKSADTYNITYVNVFTDQSLLMWTIQPDVYYQFYNKVCQKDGKRKIPVNKSCCDLYRKTASIQSLTNLSKTEAETKANKIYQDRLKENHPKKWKKVRRS